MADELQWFKFWVSEWNDGDITLCSMEAQGLFINLCSMYWSKKGNLSLAKMKRKYKNVPEKLFDELKDEGVIKYQGDSITINFLDQQLNTATKKRAKQIQTGSAGNLKRWHEDLYKEYKEGKLSLEEAWSIAKRSEPESGEESKPESEEIAEKKREEEIRGEKRRSDSKTEDSDDDDVFIAHGELEDLCDFFAIDKDSEIYRKANKRLNTLEGMSRLPLFISQTRAYIELRKSQGLDLMNLDAWMGLSQNWDKGKWVEGDNYVVKLQEHRKNTVKQFGSKEGGNVYKGKIPEVNQ